MKKPIKATSIILIIALFLHFLPSHAKEVEFTFTSYENSRGLIAVDAKIDTDMPFTEILFCVYYDSRLGYIFFDTDENCSDAGIDAESNGFVYFRIKKRTPADTSNLYVYFKPLSDLVKGSLLVFNYRAYVKYEGSEDFTELSYGNDECIFVKGVYHVISGDVNGDGRINTADAAIILSACAGKITLSDIQKKAADFNNDNIINTADAKTVLQFVVQN